jgi:hypothetical protein
VHGVVSTSSTELSLKYSPSLLSRSRASSTLLITRWSASSLRIVISLSSLPVTASSL